MNRGQRTMTYKDIKHNEEVNELLKKGNQNLGLLGYTEHSQAMCPGGRDRRPHPEKIRLSGARHRACPDRRLYARHRKRHQPQPSRRIRRATGQRDSEAI